MLSDSEKKEILLQRTLQNETEENKEITYIAQRNIFRKHEFLYRYYDNYDVVVNTQGLFLNPFLYTTIRENNRISPNITNLNKNSKYMLLLVDPKLLLISKYKRLAINLNNDKYSSIYIDYTFRDIFSLPKNKNTLLKSLISNRIISNNYDYIIEVVDDIENQKKLFTNIFSKDFIVNDLTIINKYKILPDLPAIKIEKASDLKLIEINEILQTNDILIESFYDEDIESKFNELCSTDIKVYNYFLNKKLYYKL